MNKNLIFFYNLVNTVYQNNWLEKAGADMQKKVNIGFLAAPDGLNSGQVSSCKKIKSLHFPLYITLKNPYQTL
jgi:hypothetical protein